MSELHSKWSFTNPAPESIIVWLEPWAEEFVLSTGSTIQMSTPDGSELGEIERTQEHITVWASAETVQVFIDGEFQQSASASVPAPRGLTKEMLHIVFADQPSARLGGAKSASEKQVSLWERVKGRFGL